MKSQIAFQILQTSFLSSQHEEGVLIFKNPFSDRDLSFLSPPFSSSLLSLLPSFWIVRAFLRRGLSPVLFPFSFSLPPQSLPFQEALRGPPACGGKSCPRRVGFSLRITAKPTVPWLSQPDRDETCMNFRNQVQCPSLAVGTSSLVFQEAGTSSGRWVREVECLFLFACSGNSNH